MFAIKDGSNEAVSSHRSSEHHDPQAVIERAYLMLVYYLQLSLRSFNRNKVLTALMVLALGLGIGASITTLTVLKLLSGDPLPQKSAQLFAPGLNPMSARLSFLDRPPFGNQMSYLDAMNLMRAEKAKRQAAIALTRVNIESVELGQHPFFSNGVMTTSDFFTMFNVPFEYGRGWSAKNGKDRARVVVIADSLNDKLFGGTNSVGKAIRINGHDYRIIGVLRHWSPQPKFYSVGLGGHSYGSGDTVFLPLQAALTDGMKPQSVGCWNTPTGNLKNDPCAWLGMWVELDSASDIRTYETFLSNYVRQQIAVGRFHIPKTWLPNLTEFLVQQRVIPDDARLQTYLAFGFLLICVVGTVGLLLAKCLKRSHEIGVRRALGAPRAAIFAQFMVESGVVGIAGGLLGLGFAELGLWEVRHAPTQYAHLVHLDLSMFVATFVIGFVASLLAGLLPAWRACIVAPAPQLKAA